MKMMQGACFLAFLDQVFNLSVQNFLNKDNSKDFQHIRKSVLNTFIIVT